MKFVCCLWKGKEFRKKVAVYNARHVSVLRSMLQRHGGHELICVHDGSFGVDGIRMPSQVSALPNYLPKLWTWSREFRSLMNCRFACIDLDVVIDGDVSRVFDSSPFKIWDYAKGEPYNSSLFITDPEFGTEVWEEFTLARLNAARRSSRRWTGDQSWIAHKLGPNLPTFSQDDGIINYRPSIHRAKKPELLACFMCGPIEPLAESKKSEWVGQLWQ